MKKSKYWKIIALIISFSAIFNIIAFHKGFCDWYTDNIYGFISDTAGGFTNLLPFSLGEYLMYIGIIAAVISVILLFVLIIFRKRDNIRRFSAVYYKSLLAVLSVLLMMYTVSWTVPVRGSLLGQDVPSSVEMDTEEIGRIRNYIAAELNTIAWELPRDEEAHLIYPSAEEMDEGVIQGMRSLAEEYPRLSGFYPLYKAAACSDVMDWMYIGGFTIPFTMEISVNKYSMADRIFAPILFAHESAHHQGYYKESEADYLAYIGCMRSENPLVRYSGLIHAYYELDEAYRNSMPDGYDTSSDVAVDSIVFEDISGEYRKSVEVYEEDAHPLETFQENAAEISDVGWEAQAVILKEYNYDGSTALLLRYFSENLHGDET